MIFNKHIFLVLLLALNYTYSQNNFITTPRIASPEQIFKSIIKKDQLENPIFLNGEVKNVHKKITKRATPNRKDSTQESYQYSLNRQKRVTKYASNVEFDEMNPELLNLLDKEVIIKGDTIINHDNFWYTFKNGKLILRKKKTEETGSLNIFTDSILFEHKKDKLIEVKHYKRHISTDINLNSNDDLANYDISYSEYELTNYNSALYNKNNLLESKLEIFTSQDFDYVYADHTSYKYNDLGELISYEKKSESIEFDLFDMHSYIKNRKKHNSKIKIYKTTQNNGVFTYDDKNRITNFKAKVIENDYDFDYKNKMVKLKTKDIIEAKHSYNIEYSQNKTVTTYINNGELNLQFEYIFDNNNNPIQEKIYTYISGRKYLNTSTTLDIEYFK